MLAPGHPSAQDQDHSGDEQAANATPVSSHRHGSGRAGCGCGGHRRPANQKPADASATPPSRPAGAPASAAPFGRGARRCPRRCRQAGQRGTAPSSYAAAGRRATGTAVPARVHPAASGHRSPRASRSPGLRRRATSARCGPPGTPRESPRARTRRQAVGGLAAATRPRPRSRCPSRRARAASTSAAAWVRQRVRRADADDDRGEPHAVVQPGEQRLEGQRPGSSWTPATQGAAGSTAGARSTVLHPPPSSTRNTTRTHRSPPRRRGVEPERPRPRVVRAAQRHGQAGLPRR